MKLHYIDPSAWIARYFTESGTASINALFSSPINAACSRVGFTEMIATVMRKAAGVSLSAPNTERVLDAVRTDFALFHVVPLDDLVYVESIRLILNHRLRTMDAIHLATAVTLGRTSEVVLVSSDLELPAAATAERLATVSPSLAS